MTNTTDILIIGAGPSGSVAAAILNKKGYQVTVVEKMTFPRFVIGESLLPRCMDILRDADLVDILDAGGFQKKYGAKFIYGDKECDFDFSEQFTKGSTWTWQVTRADFDKLLADSVEKRGVTYLYNTAVTDVDFQTDKVITSIENNGETSQIESKYLIDGSGYGRVLPRLLNLDAPSNQPARSAFFAHISDELRPKDIDGNRIQIVVLNQDLWAWVIPFSQGYASVGFVGDVPEFDSSKSKEENFQLLVQSEGYLKGRFTDADFIFEPKEIKGYSSAVSKFYGDRFVLTGNSTEFLDPVFSSGVTFALESGSKAAYLVADELAGNEVDWEKDYVEYIQSGVDVFRSYVNGWYDGTLPTIFFSPNINQGLKERICSVLAGYVWDHNNTYVKKHDTAIGVLAKVIKIQKRAANKSKA